MCLCFLLTHTTQVFGMEEPAYYIGGTDEAGIDMLQSVFEKVMATQEAPAAAYGAAKAEGKDADPPYVLFVLADIGTLLGIICGRPKLCAW